MIFFLSSPCRWLGKLMGKSTVLYLNLNLIRLKSQRSVEIIENHNTSNASLTSFQVFLLQYSNKSSKCIWVGLNYGILVFSGLFNVEFCHFHKQRIRIQFTRESQKLDKGSVCAKRKERKIDFLVESVDSTFTISLYKKKKNIQVDALATFISKKFPKRSHENSSFC